VSEPTGIGRGSKKLPCAGNPNRGGGTLFECGREARWVVFAPLLLGLDQLKPNLCVLAACDSHVLPVKAWMRDQVIRTVHVLGHEFTEDDEPLVDSVTNLGRLEEQFGDVWLAQPGSA
jgi:hypothetical protein